MIAAVVATDTGQHRMQTLADDGTPLAPAEDVPNLPEVVSAVERTHRPRWLWPATADTYPALLAHGVRVSRCHDLGLVEGLLLNYQGQHGSPRGLAAAWARTAGLAVPDDPPPPKPTEQPALFEPPAEALPGGATALHALTNVYRAQRERIDDVDHPDRFRLLAAEESAGALAAAEMTHDGLPWRTDIHHALLVDLLGPRPAPGTRPTKLAALAGEISVAFDGREINPDNPASIVRAFARAGIDIPSSRAWVLRQIDHPAVPPLLAYKELARIYVAHGWSWLESWVHNGRFRPEYVVGGVVSGRWATRGGAALQLPKVLRTAVRADPGWVLIVADGAQLEPRVLAALSDDRRLAEVAGDTDLYASLAEDSFAGDRARAKIAMLSAMYGGTSGEAGPLLGILRRRFPDAVGYVEAAARAGEQGKLVRSRLGRTSPPQSAAVRERIADSDERRARAAARDWGRFTRNFVVQASAADWAAALLATLRGRLTDRVPAAQLVFFQHDEVMVHAPAGAAAAVLAEIAAAAGQATELVFGRTSVRFPLHPTVVDCYADAK